MSLQIEDIEVGSGAVAAKGKDFSSRFPKIVVE